MCDDDDPDDDIESWDYPAHVPSRPPCTGNPPRWWRQHSRADRNRMRRGGASVRTYRGAVRGNWYAPPPMRLSHFDAALKKIYTERAVANLVARSSFFGIARGVAPSGSADWRLAR